MNSHIQNIIIKARDRASVVLRKVGGALKGVSNVVFNLKTAFVALGSSMALGGVASKSIKSFMTMENSMRGLSSVANKVGENFRSMGQGVTVDAESAKEAAIELSEDGLMSVADSSTALKNLLLAGFGLPKAVEMLKAFKDSAAFGRQSALSFGQAVVSAAEGVKNENSILVDNAGITKNLSVMQKDYATDLGKTVAQLSAAEKREATYFGILGESAAMAGDAAAATETLSGQFSALETDSFNLYAALGETLAPVVQSMIQEFRAMIGATKEWVEANEELLTDTFMIWGGKLIEMLESLGQWLVGGGEGAGAFSARVDSLTTSFSSLHTTLQQLGIWYDANKDILNVLGSAAAGRMLGGGVGALAGGAYAASENIRDWATGSDYTAPQVLGTQDEISGANSAAASRRAERPVTSVINNAVFTGVPTPELSR
jgi:hypothetical protein